MDRIDAKETEATIRMRFTPFADSDLYRVGFIHMSAYALIGC
uniref:Uncharacterized protein n=1 Tax=Candidatus Kentrum sp. TUN TaxID=2126343 RepID=A0A451AA12_9GAMM|nr:MAG: hypothetical protein BECKTUN1418D_GA0071000_11894 [Candidatus Kentron sp. TUN]